jgi:carbamoyl-phosphate synthase large subunit
VNVLITSASRKISLVRAFQKALAAEGGGQVIAVDAGPLAAALRAADRGYVVPNGLGEAFAHALETVCQRHAVRLIVPTRDEELPFFAAGRARWQALGVEIMVSDPAAVQTCQDKKRFLEFCRGHGFDVPPTFEPGEVRAEDYPLFVKDRFGKGSRGALAVASPEELAYVLRRVSDPIVQKLIRAAEYTVDLFADFSGRVLSVVPRERIDVVAGESIIGRTRKDAAVMDAAIRLATALGLKGHNTMQCFLDGGAVRWIEINPRYGGAANLGFVAGADTPRMLIKLLKSETVLAAIGEFIDGLVMLRYTEDLFVPGSALEEVPRVT